MCELGTYIMNRRKIHYLVGRNRNFAGGPG
jgi:hypothetical protein